MFEISQLKQVRRRLNITQAGFARLANVSQSMIAKIEAGKLDPSYSNVRKIAAAIERLAKDEERSAKDAMVKKVLYAEPKSNVNEMVRLLHKYGISQLPVIKSGKVIGIVYESSLLEKSCEKGFAMLSAEDIMENAPPTVSEDTKMTAVSALLRHFPVVLIAKKGEVTGLITKADILRILI